MPALAAGVHGIANKRGRVTPSYSSSLLSPQNAAIKYDFIMIPQSPVNAMTSLSMSRADNTYCVVDVIVVPAFSLELV